MELIKHLFTGEHLLLNIGSFITTYLYFYMHRTFYGYNKFFKKHLSLISVIYVLIWIGVVYANSLETPVVNLIASITSYFIPLFVCYRINNARGVVYYFFYMFGTFLSEIIIGVSGGYLQNGMGNSTRYDAITPQISVMMNLLEIIIVIVICKFGSRDEGEKNDKTVFLLAAMPAVSVVLIIAQAFMLANGMLKDFNPNQFFVDGIVLTIINITVFIVLESHIKATKREMQLMQEKMKIEADADMLEIATKTMKDKLSNAEANIRKDRQMRHDRRHFESLMLSLLEENKVDEAKRCLEEMLATEPKSILHYCDNTAVNAAISHYVSVAKAKDIEVTVNTTIPIELSVDDIDLAIVVSNLLENAIHSCEKIEEGQQYIKLTAKYKKQLLLEIENSCLGVVPLDEDGHPFSDEINHGIGTKSVLAFAEKTGSIVEYSAMENVFKVRMIIG